MSGNEKQVKFSPGTCDVNFILKHRFVMLSVLLGLTVFFCVHLTDIKMAKEPLETMYPTGHKFLPAINAIKKMAPEPSMVVGVLEVKNGDIYNTKTIDKIDRITRGLMSIDGIMPSGITSLTRGVDHMNNSVDGFRSAPILGKKWPETSAEFELLKRKVAVNAMGIGRYVSYDHTAVMITAKLSDIDQKMENAYQQLTDAEKETLSFKDYKKQQTGAFQDNLLKRISDLKLKEDDANHTFYFMGMEILMAQMTEMGKRDIPIAAGTMLFFVIALSAFYFRTFPGIFIPVVAMIISILWGLGIFGWCGVEFNPMALLFPLAMGLLSLAFSVLTLKQYYRLNEKIKDKNLAIAATYGSTPVMISILTVGLVTLSLYAVDVPMIKDLGVFGLFWMVGTFAAVILINPILISFFPVSKVIKTDVKDGACQSLVNHLMLLSGGKGKYVIPAVLAVIIAIGCFCVANLEVGDNAPGSSYIRNNHPWNQCFSRLAKKFMGPYQLLVYVKAKEKGGITDPDALNAIGDFSDYLKNQGGAKDSIAFDMMIKIVRTTLMDGNPKWQVIPEKKAQVEGLGGMVVAQGGVESFIDKTYTQATISPFFPEKDAGHIDTYASRIQAYIDNHPSDKVEFYPGGGLLGMTKMLNDGTRDTYTKVLIAAFFGCVIFGTLATGSVLLGVLVSIPVAVAQAVLWIGMTIAGMPVSLPVVPASAVAIGFGPVFGYLLLGQVFGVHNGLRSYNHGNARENRFGKTGEDVMFTGIIIFAASLPWFFIGMKFQSTMMLVLGLTVLLEAIAAVIFIPAVAGWLKQCSE